MDINNDIEKYPQTMGINPPPVLTPRKSDRDYIPQIHADERQGYVDCKLMEETTQEENKPPIDPKEIKSPTQNLQKEYVKPQDTEKSEKLPYPTEKKAIKLITVPHEKEGLNNIVGESPNPQEYDSPSIDMRSPQKEGDNQDSAGLSPNSKLPVVRKKSILKGSPNLLQAGDNSHRFDAEGNVISDDKKHRISFRADLYQINEIESYKNNNNDDFWKKCCRFCTIQ